MLAAGVTDKWHWNRNLIIKAYICSGPSCTVVAQIRETESVSLNGRRSDALLTLQVFSGGPIKPRMLVQCQKDNGWFPTSACSSNQVIGTTWLSSVWKDASYFYHPNPSTPDGIWTIASVDYAQFICEADYPSTELCRLS